MSERVAIVNADDFGQTSGINAGIVRAHEEGVVTSASLLVNHGAAEEAGAYARAHPELSVGLHVDFGEAAYRGGTWETIYALPTDDAETVAREVGRQLAAFRGLVGADPTHLDSHQHAHMDEPVRTVVKELGRTLGAPVRNLQASIRYVGGFYGQDKHGVTHLEWVSTDALVELLRTLPDGISEIGCHPGYYAGLESSYLQEREHELATLCDPEVRAAIAEAGIELRSFREVAATGLRSRPPVV